MKYVWTEWDIWDYEVWGNDRDGYEVNNRFCRGGYGASREPQRLRLRVVTHNPGTAYEFEAAHPTYAQLRRLFGPRLQLDVDGDDTNVYVRRLRDSYPLGEMTCVSHASLSPIRRVED